uniref:DUF4817 domain-containing protein n=1 Tax=Lutzomyia longipalpis TaxID=7200 RepID=A0A1B0CLP5_LUTLO
MRNEFRARFPGRPLPDGRTVRRLINRFESSGTVKDAPRSGRPSVRNEEFVESVRESVRNAPSTSTRKRAAQLRASRTTLRRVLRHLKMFPYKVQQTQQLQPQDHQSRLNYCHAFIELNERIDNFRDIILMSDEAHFHLCGGVNKQNMRFWGTENPRVIHEVPLHSPKVTVWCGIMSNRSSLACAPRDSFLFSAATIVIWALRSKFCSSSVSTRSEFQISDLSNTFTSLKDLYTSAIFRTPSWRVCASRKTAACVCIVFCMFKRNVAVGMAPLAFRKLSKFATEASPEV